ncbi:hypothetical protein [Ureaplasma ceti]|uniref:Signal recognition particle-docking protein FtsY n=1 Tax=Ureaplasma ceti TaxID=3119530 RepID=A0ABP9UBK8_9BACT
MSFFKKLKDVFSNKKNSEHTQEQKNVHLSKNTEGLFKEAEVTGQSEEDITRALDIDDLE